MSLSENDVVNVRLRADDAEYEDTTSTLRRARVLQLLPQGVQVQLDDSKEAEPQRRVVDLKDIEQRVQVPWKPRDLADNFIVFRRRLGRSEQYIEELRVRKKSFVEFLSLIHI